eukprot:4519761-Pleurochrysis_carterae.AAC.2
MYGAHDEDAASGQLKDTRVSEETYGWTSSTGGCDSSSQAVLRLPPIFFMYSAPLASMCFCTLHSLLAYCLPLRCSSSDLHSLLHVLSEAGAHCSAHVCAYCALVKQQRSVCGCAR